MARKSRKGLITTSEQVVEKKYRVAAYVRLSLADNGKRGDSIEIQKSIILEYIENHPDLELSSVYCDNGATGTNFNRNGFESMMEDIKAKKIDCIVVKDLSRFGRDYIETGNYLEKVFPFLGIRFISVADKFDTFDAEKSEDGYIIPLKNLIHDIYAKDISKKAGITRKLLIQKGQYVGSIAPYGYKFAEGDKHKLVIDDEVAHIAKRIFDMRASGVSLISIAKQLESEGITSPNQYRYEKKILKQEKYKNASWTTSLLSNMLKNEIYTGKMVQGKTKQSLYHREKHQRTERDEYIIVPGTHEPIISEETFEKVIEQHMINVKKFGNIPKRETTPPNIFKGLIFCGVCGSPLYASSSSVTTSVQEHIYHFYYCKNKLRVVDKCSLKHISREMVLQAVIETVKKHIEEIVLAKHKIIDSRRKNSVIANQNLIKADIRNIEAQISNANKYKKSLLEQYLSKKVNETTYLEFISSYDLDIEKLNQEIVRLHQCLIESEMISKAKWIDSFEQFSIESDITFELIQSLISRIIAYGNDKIEIEFKYSDEFQNLLRKSKELHDYE
ncbi:MAG: recombinase family protein [Eubacteriales bacterium]